MWSSSEDGSILRDDMDMGTGPRLGRNAQKMDMLRVDDVHLLCFVLPANAVHFFVFCGIELQDRGYRKCGEMAEAKCIYVPQSQ